jgi:hypothetical protein
MAIRFGTSGLLSSPSRRRPSGWDEPSQSAVSGVSKGTRLEEA